MIDCINLFLFLTIPYCCCLVLEKKKNKLHLNYINGKYINHDNKAECKFLPTDVRKCTIYINTVLKNILKTQNFLLIL